MARGDVNSKQQIICVVNSVKSVTKEFLHFKPAVFINGFKIES